ncbi:MAG: ADP-glyceromanno-heptose 6-epimerase [Lentisphaerae bacterium]|nr:ADP-glyceromanno-heptose 6-epimerase [Lentisphaerota bacterium]MBR4883971.1 ADP-glyceromanno-heptose 6-epimerase [Lentisphaeria bacterium]
MKYIVTGASGLIGSAAVWALNKAGEHDILAVDHLGTSEKWKNLRALRFTDYMERDTFMEYLLQGDILDGVQGIIHMGACSSTTETDATYLVHNNFEYTKTLAELAAAKGIRFIYASSAATYGDGEQGYKDDESQIEKLRPLNMYGYSKQMFDLWAKKNGLLKEITGVKFTNVYGPNELHKGGMRSMVCRSFEQIRDNGCVNLFKSYHPDYADGEQKRDFLYVKDAVDMVLFLLERKNLTGLYNIGSGKAETWNQLASAAFAAMGREVKINYIEMPEHLKGKYQYYTCADMAKMRAAGYTKEPTSLEDAIKDDIQVYLQPGKFLGDE